MIEGYIPVPVEHFGGLICSWPPEMLDADLMAEATNVRFTSAAVGTREGLTRAMAVANGQQVRGLLDFVKNDGTSQPVVFAADGALYAESPAGSGRLALAAPESNVVLPADAWMNGVAVYNRCYLALGDGARGVTAPASFDGSDLDPVTLAAPTGVASPSDSGAAGNIASGQRYGVVLYQTREGSLTAPSLPFGWNAIGGKQAMVANLPIGPAQVAARVVAFTVAGGSSAGPYYYIQDGQTVNGVVETSTVVNDNVTTTATFNFDDDFLAASNDVSDQFRAILLPAMAGVVYSETTERLMWWGDPSQPSVVQCSQPGDGGVYFGDTGFFEVAPDNGQRVTAVFEFRNRIYVAKESSLHLVTPNNGDPATWDISEVSPVVGACGIRAAAVGDGYVILVHSTGCFQFTGAVPTLLSDELLGPAVDQPGLWNRINWSACQQIWAAVDSETRCVRLGVPLDQSAECSDILKISYLEGWEASIRFSAFTARYHYFPGRRWSRDTIAASQAVAMTRPLAAPALMNDRRQAIRQVMLACVDAVHYLDADARADNGQPILWALTTGGISASELLKQQRQGMEMVGLVQARMRGTGRVNVASVTDGGAPMTFLRAPVAAQVATVQGLALAQGEAVGLRFTSQDGAGTMELLSVYAFARPTWTLRPVATGVGG